MSNQDPIVVIGAGQCGLKAVETLRQAGYDGALQLVGEEPHAPYQRPPLSKAFLKGAMSEDRLQLTHSDFFSDQNIETCFGSKVVRLDTGAHIAELDDGHSLRYSKALVATGSRPRPLPLPGSDLSGVHTLRTLNDTKYLAETRSGKTSIAIIGGGYIGLEVAASMRVLGHEVTVIEGAQRVLERVVCPQVSQFFEDLHARNGVAIRKGILPTALTGDGHVTAVELADGQSIACNVVLIAIGGVPNVDLAASAGLPVDGGIHVDEACRTSAPDVFAAGDCAFFPSRRYGRHIRLESVQNAIDQGKAAARSMLGEVVSYDPVPWFWSDQFDAKLQIAGLSQGFDRVETCKGPRDESFSVTYFSQGRMICVDAVNFPRAHMLARRQLAGD
ncbi:MAG: NAD(P)/FAD-dependent oxidoreductase [Hyphomicrobiaceae bacterium]